VDESLLPTVLMAVSMYRIVLRMVGKR